ncbi:hypothetical protein LTR50_001330 [Elasticomyces elasticus]|nr:hypothetical protein LTR50_001330 [Elasticomyces elasticus]
MIQLDRFSFDRGGSILFDEHEKPVSIGPTRHVDNQAMLERLDDDNPNEIAIYTELGQYTDPKSFYTSVLDRRPEPPTVDGKGARKLLRLFLDWIPEPTDGREAFVLAHPDFDIQNFIVSEEGELRGIIDWDGVAAVPRSLGNESYPGWLTRDWDPAMYGWTHEMEEGVEPEGVWEDSPETLAFFRTMYADFMEISLARDEQAKEQKHSIDGERTTSSSPVSLTRNSLIAENLYIAADNPLCTALIMRKVFEEIAKVVGKTQYVPVPSDSRVNHAQEEEAEIRNDDAPGLEGTSVKHNTTTTTNDQSQQHLTDNMEVDQYEPDDFHFYDVACDFEEGILDDRRMSYLKRGFTALLS